MQPGSQFALQCVRRALGNTVARVAHFATHVQMRLTKPAKGPDTKEEMVFSAEALALDYGKKLARFSGQVTMQVAGRRITVVGVVQYDLTSGSLDIRKMTPEEVIVL